MTAKRPSGMVWSPRLSALHERCCPIPTGREPSSRRVWAIEEAQPFESDPQKNDNLTKCCITRMHMDLSKDDVESLHLHTDSKTEELSSDGAGRDISGHESRLLALWCQVFHANADGPAQDDDLEASTQSRHFRLGHLPTPAPCTALSHLRVRRPGAIRANIPLFTSFLARWQVKRPALQPHCFAGFRQPRSSIYPCVRRFSKDSSP